MMLAALVLAAVARESLGVYGGWGAFRDTNPPRCFAVAKPVRAGAGGRSRPFASVASWPARGRRGVVFLRLSRVGAATVPVTLSVGERRFTLAGTGQDAWSPDPATDRAIVAAIRGERSMSVTAVGEDGHPFADTYALIGAATAIDSAALGCAGRDARPA